MSHLPKWLKEILAYGKAVILKLKNFLVGLTAIGLGILFGYFYTLSSDSAEITISIIVIFTVLVIIINRPLYGFLVLLVMMPFLEEWVEIPMGEGIPDLSFSRFVIPFLAVFMLARAATGKLRFARPMIGMTEIAIVGAWVGIMTAAPLSEDPITLLQTLLSWYCLPLMAYFFARHLVENEADLHKLMWAVVIFGVAAAAYAVYEHTTGHILFIAKGEDASKLLTDYSENLKLIRGLLERAGNFGRVFLTTIPVALYLFFESKHTSRKLLLAVMLVLQFYVMFITYNRTAWYALGVNLFLLQLIYPQFRKIYAAIMLMGAIALLATWDQVNDSAVVQERVNSKVSTLEGREGRWQAGYNMWRAQPIRGWGFDQYEKESGRFRTDGEPWNYNAVENDYLYIMVGSGLIGFLPYLIFLLAPLINSLRLYFRARAPDWSGYIKPETIGIYWVVIIGYAVGSYTQMQNVPIVKMLAFAIAGAVVGTHQYLLRRTPEHSVQQLRPTIIAVNDTQKASGSV